MDGESGQYLGRRAIGRARYQIATARLAFDDLLLLSLKLGMLDWEGPAI